MKKVLLTLDVSKPNQVYRIYVLFALQLRRAVRTTESLTSKFQTFLVRTFFVRAFLVAPDVIIEIPQAEIRSLVFRAALCLR